MFFLVEKKLFLERKYFSNFQNLGTFLLRFSATYGFN